MKKLIKKLVSRVRRHKRIRTRVNGTPERPRLTFFKSNKHLYVQLIDDVAGKTLLGLSSQKSGVSGSVAQAENLGSEIAKRAKEKGIESAVFDRGGFVYTGAAKAFADAARAGGLKF